MTARELAREYFPDYNDKLLDDIIWNLTGFPSFWEKGTVEENLRIDLANVKRRVKNGEAIEM